VTESPSDRLAPVALSLWARRTLAEAATIFSVAAATAVSRIPSRPIKNSSPARAPATAPNVFQPYKRPRTRPKLTSREERVLTRTGKVTPMAVDGISSRRKARKKRRG